MRKSILTYIPLILGSLLAFQASGQVEHQNEYEKWLKEQKKLEEAEIKSAKEKDDPSSNGDDESTQ